MEEIELTQQDCQAEETSYAKAQGYERHKVLGKQEFSEAESHLLCNTEMLFSLSGLSPPLKNRVDDNKTYLTTLL